MAHKFVLDIEKYLDHQVNAACDIYDKDWDPFFGPDRFREAVGVPLALSHHRDSTKTSKYTRQYFMFDFEDFLEYATSDLPNPFSINQIPLDHCCYYQGFPKSYESPHFENRYGKFAVMAACLSRQENHLWITVHFKTQTEALSSTEANLVDLVGRLRFFQEFVSMHLVEVSKAELEGVLGKESLHRFDTNWSDGVLEFTRARITPPFPSDWPGYLDEDVLIKAGYTIMYAGALWEEIAESLELNLKNREIPSELSQSGTGKLLLSEKERVTKYRAFFEHQMADQFEIVRLMRFLPSYFDFMYDLVIEEKKQVGARIVSKTIKKTRKKKIIQKPIVKIVKSLRVSYVAENEARSQLNIAPRKWTAPAYSFAIRGHWRSFRDATWRGHDQEGKEISGRTWVKEYVKGSKTESSMIETRDPNVVIKLKQPLSYARDVIEAHKRDRSAIVAAPDLAHSTSGKPSDEWMYEERIKLTAGLRWIILRRDNFKCTACGKGADDGIKLEVDHIVPVEKWGKTEESNLRALCKDCNRGKGASA